MFTLKDKQSTVVAGLIVQSGKLHYSGSGGSSGQYVYRVVRDRNTVAEELASQMLKRFKDTVHEVDHGNECGLVLGGFNDYREGDEIECLKVEWKARSLQIEDGASGSIAVQSDSSSGSKGGGSKDSEGKKKKKKNE